MSELAEEIPEMNWLDEQLAIRDRESFAKGLEQGKLTERRALLARAERLLSAEDFARLGESLDENIEP